jgi:ferredoxin-NADP reductase
VERAALPRGLTWQLGSVVEIVDETPRTKSIALALPAWPGHRAGQHVDVRLTAEDGFQARRSYAIASAPEDDHVVLTVERVDDGEVSPYLVDELRPGDQLELRGPLGGYFVWMPRSAGRFCSSPAAQESCRCARFCVTTGSSRARCRRDSCTGRARSTT